MFKLNYKDILLVWSSKTLQNNKKHLYNKYLQNRFYTVKF
ncbi:DUF6275 family protein [Mycoplasmopsis agassizii]